MESSGVVDEVTTKYPRTIKNLPLPEEGFEAYLGEDEAIKCNDALIKETVAAIIKGEKDPFIIVKKLSAWINKNIKKIPTVSFPNTLDVLKVKQGDCGELSALLVGLLRSAGVPAYVNIGIVYEEGRFFYHAWVSAYVGEWIDTDPALNQLIADATHIKLLKGFKNQFEIFKIIGKLKVDILEYK